MNRYLGLIIILILGVFALLLIYLMTSVSKTESFGAHEHAHVNKNNKQTSAVVASHNPHRLPMAPIDETCNNKFSKKGFVSVQEFMDGERYRCYE